MRRTINETSVKNFRVANPANWYAQDAEDTLSMCENNVKRMNITPSDVSESGGNTLVMSL